MAESEIERRILQRLGAAQDILDVGCGEGRLVNFLARETNKKIVGLDISDHGFAQARKDAAKANIPGLVNCVKSDAQRMAGFKDGQFEAVTMVYTLHHIDDPEAALGEVRRVLKPGGKVLIGELVVKPGATKSDCHRFTVQEIRRLLARMRFLQVEVEQVESDVALVVARKGRENP